jgi:hypothetical protein
MMEAEEQQVKTTMRGALITICTEFVKTKPNSRAPIQ